jgi:hypothetical protein
MLIDTKEIFASLDARRAAAEATIAQYTPEQAAEASRVARLYDRCDPTSIKHAEDTARQLREIFGAPKTDMNKHQLRECANCARYAAAGHRDMAARGLSALYRAAMREKQKQSILAFSLALGVVSHPDFIV